MGPSVLEPSWTVLGLSGPSWGRLGAVLGPSWGHLGPSWAVLGPSWGHLGPSWGRLGAVLGLLGQLGTQDRPKRAQESPKTILSPFWDHFGAQNWHFSGSFLRSCFGPVFGHFLDQFWSHFRDHFGTRSAQEGAKMSPKRSIRSFKDPKRCICKNLKKQLFFLRFLGSRGLPREP